MAGWLPVAVAMPFAGALLASGIWASRRYARFDQLPGHYDFTGRPTRMTSRRVMVWMLPVLFSVSLIGLALFTAVLPQEMQNGDPSVGLLISGAALLGAQLLVLWLTDRWARTQR